MSGARKRQKRNGGSYKNFQGWYFDREGQRVYFTGTESKRETLEIAREKEKYERGIRDGTVIPEKREQKRLFKEIVQDYLDWGNAQGGRKGNPWSSTHARMKKSYLSYWEKELKPKSITDLNGCLPKVEKLLRTLKDNGKSGKTLVSYADGLSSFCEWCVDRDFLEKNPLNKIAPIKAIPKTVRRAMTIEEIKRLFEHCDPSKRLLYETAILSGLRAGELGHLRVKNINLENGEIILEESWTKNRKHATQQIPNWLVEKLRKEIAGKGPNDKIFDVPSHPARELDKDLKKAQIPKETDEGKIDFHAFRVACITLLFETGGATPVEAQEIARHSTLDLTMIVYARTRKENLKRVVEKIGESINGFPNSVSCIENNSEKKWVTRGSQAKKRKSKVLSKVNKIKELSGEEGKWRRRELNPRPRTPYCKALHA